MDFCFLNTMPGNDDTIIFRNPTFTDQEIELSCDDVFDDLNM